MPKIFSGLISLFLLSFLLAPSFTYGLNINIAPAPLVTNCYLYHDLTFIDNDCNRGDTVNFEGYAQCCIVNIIYNIVTVAFYGILGLVIVFILLGTYYIASAGGDAAKMNTGRKFIIWGIVGFALGMAVFFLPRLAIRVFFPVHT